MYQPITNINTPSTIPQDNIINDRNHDILNAINNYQFPTNDCKILLKINTNKLSNNKFLVYKYSGDKSNQFEISQNELENILELVSHKKCIRIEYITEPLNSDNDLNENFYEINNNQNIQSGVKNTIPNSNSEKCFT